MLRHTPRSTRNDTLCPYTTLCRSSASKRLNQRLDTIPNEIGTGVLSFALLSAAFAHAAQAPVAQLDRALPSEGCTPPSRQGFYIIVSVDRKSTRLNSSHSYAFRMPLSA